MGGLIEIPYVKQPWEQRTLRLDFTGDCQPLIDNGYAYSTLQVKVYDSGGVDVTDTLITGTPSRTGNYVYATVTGGTDETDYYVRARLTMTKTDYDSQQIEGDLLVQVREKGK